MQIIYYSSRETGPWWAEYCINQEVPAMLETLKKTCKHIRVADTCSANGPISLDKPPAHSIVIK